MSVPVEGFVHVKALSNAGDVQYGTLAGGASGCVVHTVRGHRSLHGAPTLRGPGIAGVLQVVNDATHVSVVSEPGVALLSERLDVVKRLTETQSKQVFRQMVDALQSLHATSATHGLVSVESFLMQSTESDVHLLLTDFALQRVLDASSFAALLRRRPSALAPEVIESVRVSGSQGVTVAPAADVWGLGVTLYMMLSGLAPFVDGHSDVVTSVLRGRVSFEHSRWKTVSVEAKAFVTQLLNVQPAARPSLAAILAHSWLQGVVVPPAPSGGRMFEADKPREQIVVLEAAEPEPDVAAPLAKRPSSANSSTVNRKREREASTGAAAVSAVPARSSASAAVETAAGAAAPEPQTKRTAHATLSASALRKLKVAELRIECTVRGLSEAGTKDTMIARIVQFQEGK